MTELVKIEQDIIGGNEVNSVNARDLWIALESKQQFADWIKHRLDDIGAIEGEDYLTLHKKMKRQILNVLRATLNNVITKPNNPKKCILKQEGFQGQVGLPPFCITKKNKGEQYGYRYSRRL